MGSPFVVLNVGDMHPCAHSDSYSLTLSCLAILSRTLLCVCFITCSGVYVCVCSLFFSCGYVCSCTPPLFFFSRSLTLSLTHTHTLSLSLALCRFGPHYRGSQQHREFPDSHQHRQILGSGGDCQYHSRAEWDGHTHITYIYQHIQ